MAAETFSSTRPSYVPAAPTAPAERRAAPRAVVDLWVEERTDDALYFQRATSLSATGLFLDRTLPHPPGTRVALDLRFPGEPAPMRLHGEVCEPRDPNAVGMAVRFLDLSIADRARLLDFVARAPFRVSPGAG